MRVMLLIYCDNKPNPLNAYQSIECTFACNLSVILMLFVNVEIVVALATTKKKKAQN